MGACNCPTAKTASFYLAGSLSLLLDKWALGSALRAKKTRYRQAAAQQIVCSQCLTPSLLGMQYLDLFPDPEKASCMSAWNRTYTASFLSDDAEWHHLAVTWTREHNGRMRVFKDGLMMAEVASSLPLR